MIHMLKLRIKQRGLNIRDPQAAVPPAQFRGLPVLHAQKCVDQCTQCREVCPSEAIHVEPLRIDLGKCILCGDCVKACPQQVIELSAFHRMGSTRRDMLIIDSTTTPEILMRDAIQTRAEIIRLFGRSLKLRQVSAGGCNGCEMELNASANINFDIERYGVEFTASPRHADGLVITGPITENMTRALDDAYQSTPSPKVVILVGACAISGGIFTGSEALQREFLTRYPIDLYIPGCPIHPLTFIDAVMRFLGRF